MKLTRRECLAALTTVGVASGCNYSPTTRLLASRAVADPFATASIAPPVKSGGGDMPQLTHFTPELFGAIGDGVTNDTDAFAKMCEAVNRAGGGTIILRSTTYIVGAQSPDPTGFWAYAPATIMNFDGCTKDLTIDGNGARLRCADGLRYGTFDAMTGLPTQNAMPYTGTGQLASPYRAMLMIQNCTGKVYIKKLELDGNLGGLKIGGPYGDTGWQIPAIGLQLMNNVGGEEIVVLRSHHHGQDGIYIDGVPNRTTATSIGQSMSTYNGRQGCSVVGGCNYAFTDCAFSHTGRAVIVSAPAAGVDIEAEVTTVRNLSFDNCEFSNNCGAGMVADSGDTDGAIFRNCRFIGTDTWSAWPKKPNFRFVDCQFFGSICNVHADTDPNRATQFLRCSFSDDVSQSPTGKIYGASLPIADLGGGDQNVLFDSCQFDLKNGSVLPWTVWCTFNNCTMSQTSDKQAYPRGTFSGTDTINGNVDLYGSKILGDLTVNGHAWPRTS